MNFYTPPNIEEQWSCRPDAMPDEYFSQVIKPLDLNQQISLEPAYALLGFASDAGVFKNFGRRGASEGPDAIRQVLGGMPYHGQFNIHDAGNIQVPYDDDLEHAQQDLSESVHQLLCAKQFPIVLGGGHETAYGHFHGLRRFYQKDIAIVNFDAHFDLRPVQNTKFPSTSGTPFRQIYQLLKQQLAPFDYYCVGIQQHANTKALFQFADTCGAHYLLAKDIHQDPNNLDFIKNVIHQHHLIYVTVCLDTFAAHLAPGVSAPQVLGLEACYVLNALKLLKQSGKVIALDIVELNPKYDIDRRTAKLAAHLIINFLEY